MVVVIGNRQFKSPAGNHQPSSANGVPLLTEGYSEEIRNWFTASGCWINFYAVVTKSEFICSFMKGSGIVPFTAHPYFLPFLYSFCFGDGGSGHGRSYCEGPQRIHFAAYQCASGSCIALIRRSQARSMD